MGVYTDTWVDTPLANLDTHSPWITNQGGFNFQPVTGIGIQCNNPAAAQIVFAHYNNTMSNDQFVQAVVQLPGSSNAAYIGVALRVATGTGKTGYYFIYRDTGADSFFGWQNSSGTATDIGGSRGTWANGDVMYMSIVGTTWTLKKNGSTLATGSDSNVASGFAGICGANASTGVIAPNWQGGDANPTSTKKMNSMTLLGVGY